MRHSVGRIVRLIVIMCLMMGPIVAMAAENSLISRKMKGQEQKSRQKSRLQIAEERAEAAEKRARDAENAATQASREASQALEAAQRANEMLSRLQESLAQIERTTGHTAEEVASLKKTNDLIAVEMKSLRATHEAGAKRVDAIDKKTEGAMTSVSDFPVKIYGNILFNSSYSNHGSNGIDIPLFAQKAGTSSDQNHQNFTMTLRQSRFGMRYEGKIFANAKLTGVFEFDLLGGKPAFANGVDFDLFRLRLAYGRIDWAKNSLEVGQDWTVFSPLNPTTLASYAIVGFSASGNLWNRIPQIRYEHRQKVGQKSRFIFTSALLDPNAGNNVGNPATRVIGLGERGSLPALESRLGFTSPTHGKESSAGVSGHYSRLLAVPGNPAGTLVRSPIDSYGVSGDGNVWLTSGLRVSGEIFHGRALGILSGNIGQSVAVVAGRARGMNSTGGWFEVHGEAPAGYEGVLKRFSANFGYGAESNRERDLLAGLRKRNQTYMINGQYRFSPHFTLAVEYRLIETRFFQQPFADQKLNWGNVAFFYSF